MLNNMISGHPSSEHEQVIAQGTCSSSDKEQLLMHLLKLGAPYICTGYQVFEGNISNFQFCTPGICTRYPFLMKHSTCSKKKKKLSSNSKNYWIFNSKKFAIL